MKKLQIISLIAVTSLSFVYAQENREDNRPLERINSFIPMVRQAIVNKENKQDDAPRMQQLTTGDANIDAQVAVLTKEMEEKIKVIRDEYMVKIKALVGDKATVRGAMMGTTTPPGMYRGEKMGFDEGNKLGRPMMGTTTTTNNMRPVLRDVLLKENEKKQDGSSLLKGFSPSVRDFFRGFFGENK